MALVQLSVVEQRLDAVRAVLAGARVGEVAASLGVSRGLISPAHQALAGRARPFASRPAERPPQMRQQRQHFPQINRHPDEVVATRSPGPTRQVGSPSGVTGGS
jgi:hypothetical protein